MGLIALGPHVVGLVVGGQQCLGAGLVEPDLHREVGQHVVVGHVEAVGEVGPQQRLLQRALHLRSLRVERPRKQPVGVEGVGAPHPRPPEVDAEVSPGVGEAGVGRLDPAQVTELPDQVLGERWPVAGGHGGVELEGAVHHLDVEAGLLDGPLEARRAHVAPRARHIAPDLHLHAPVNRRRPGMLPVPVR